MTKYGGGLYGGSTYGATPITPDGAVQWICQIAWDGSFSGTNEAAWMTGLDIKRGREFYVASGAEGLEAMQPGQATLTLENHDGRYDPYNTGSPLSPNVAPGKQIIIQVKDISTGTIHTVFTGHVTDIRPISDNKQVTITAADGLKWLDDQELTIAAATSTTISAAVTSLVGAAAYPWGHSIQTWAQPVPVFDPSPGTYDTALKRVKRTPFTALSVIQELADASLGTLFVDASGVIRYYPIDYNSMTTHTFDQAVLLKEIKVGQPWENIRNKVKTSAIRRGKRPLAAIWQMSSPIEIANNATKTFAISFPNAVDVSSPWWGTWTSNSAADGSGTDESVHTIPYLSNITATSATMSIMNAGSGVTLYMTKLSVSGRVVVEIPVQYTAEDAGSIASYGPRRFTLENTWLQDAGYAEAFATLIKDQLKAPTKNPVIRIEAREDIQYSVELMDKVHLDSAKLGIDNTYWVGGIEHKWQAETGQSVLTTLYLQSVIYSADAITADVFYPGVDLQPELPPTSTPAGVTMTGDATGMHLWGIFDITSYTDYVWNTIDLAAWTASSGWHSYYPDSGSWLDGSGQIVISEPGVYTYSATVRMYVDYHVQLSDSAEFSVDHVIVRRMGAKFKVRFTDNPASTADDCNVIAHYDDVNVIDSNTYMAPGPTITYRKEASSSGEFMVESTGSVKFYFQIEVEKLYGSIHWNNIYVDIVFSRIGDIP